MGVYRFSESIWVVRSAGDGRTSGERALYGFELEVEDGPQVSTHAESRENDLRAFISLVESTCAARNTR